MTSVASGRACALVTGASGGLGIAFAERLARDGHDLVLVARRLDRLQQVGGRLQQTHGVQVTVIRADLNDTAALGEVETVLANNNAMTLLVKQLASQATVFISRAKNHMNWSASISVRWSAPPGRYCPA